MARVRVFLPSRPSSVTAVAPVREAPYITLDVGPKETSGSFKTKVLETLKQRQILHLSSARSQAHLFQLHDKRTGRALLDERVLVSSFFLFDDDPSQTSTIDVTLVEKGRERVRRATTMGFTRARLATSELSPEPSTGGTEVDTGPAESQQEETAMPTQVVVPMDHGVSPALVDEEELARSHRQRLGPDPETLELPTECYDVIKINQRGRRQRRLLRLTNRTLENVRGEKVTAQHDYSDVFCVTLADHETLVISFLNDRDFTYVSPIAMQIVQEINRRLGLRRHNEKRTFTYNLASLALKYQEKLHRQHLEDVRSQTRDSVLLNVLREGAQRTNEVVKQNGLDSFQPVRHRGHQRSATTIPSRATSLHAHGRGSGSLSVGSTSAMGVAASRRNLRRKIAALTGTTEHERLQHAVDRVLLDSSTEEGRARARFIANFNVLERKPATLAETMRQFMDSLKHHMQTTRTEELNQLMVEDRASSSGDATVLEAAPPDIGQLIERSLESAIVLPVFQRVVKCLLKLTNSREAVIQAKIVKLRYKHQSFFGIQPDQISATHWSAAQYELSFLEKRPMPMDKLEVLLNAARAIYNSYNYEKNQAADIERAKARQQREEEEHRRQAQSLARLQPRDTPEGKDSPSSAQTQAQEDDELTVKNYFLNADEFFPIFVYVVINSRVAHHEMNKMYMWGLCDRSALSGEAGYYLTVYEACLEYILNLDIEDLERKQVIEHEQKSGTAPPRPPLPPGPPPTRRTTTYR